MPYLETWEFITIGKFSFPIEKTSKRSCVHLVCDCLFELVIVYLLTRGSSWHFNILCSYLKPWYQNKCYVSKTDLYFRMLKFAFTDIWTFSYLIKSYLDILGSHYAYRVSIALFSWIWNVCLHSRSSYSLQNNTA